MSQEVGRSNGGNSDAAPYSFGGEWTPSPIELGRRASRQAKGRRNALIATISSLVVLGTLAIVVVTSPGWKV